MGIFINIISTILTIAEYMTFCYVFFRKNATKKTGSIITGAIILATIVLVSCIFPGTVFLPALQIISTLAILFCFFETGFFDTLKMWLIAFPVLMMIEYIPYMFVSSDTVLIDYMDTIGLSVIIILMWLYHFLFSKKYSDEVFVLEDKTWISVSVEFFVLLGLILIFTYSHNQNEEKNDIRYVAVTVIIVCILILNLLVFRNYNAKRSYILENRYLDMLNKQQRDHFELLLSKEEETRKYRHDINNELIELKALLKEGKTEEAYRFVNEMDAALKEIRGKIYSVGNQTVDIMLNYILVPVREECDIKIRGTLREDLNISSRDLCIIVSNLLQNAVEAVKKIAVEKRLIRVFVSCGMKNMVFRIENSIPESIEKTTDKLLVSVKSDKRNHGLGLKNVRNTVERNNGCLTLENHDDIFTAEARFSI